jgi:hypothetical protein
MADGGGAHSARTERERLMCLGISISGLGADQRDGHSSSRRTTA